MQTGRRVIEADGWVGANRQGIVAIVPTPCCKIVEESALLIQAWYCSHIEDNECYSFTLSYGVVIRHIPCTAAGPGSEDIQNA